MTVRAATWPRAGTPLTVAVVLPEAAVERPLSHTGRPASVPADTAALDFSAVPARRRASEAPGLYICESGRAASRDP